MVIRFNLGGKMIEITTDHAASSYGIPVVVVDGDLTNGQVYYERDPPDHSTLDSLADSAHIHDGPVTRSKLHGLAAAMLDDGIEPTGADYDRVIAAFKAHPRIAAAELTYLSGTAVRYYIYHQQCNSPGKNAGEIYIYDNETQQDVPGSFAPHERWRAERKLKELEDAEIPDIFEGMFDGPET